MKQTDIDVLIKELKEFHEAADSLKKVRGLQQAVLLAARWFALNNGSSPDAESMCNAMKQALKEFEG